MRLICPKCAAQYEVDPDKIPDSGREVHCSACGNTWFQPGINAYSEPLALGAPATPSDPLAHAISRIVRKDAPAPPQVEQSALDILREEAARETQARLDEGTLLPDEAQSAEQTTVMVEQSQKGGFWIGFGAVLLISLIALALYLYSGPLGRAFPSLNTVLEDYRAQVEAARAWIEAILRDVQVRL